MLCHKLFTRSRKHKNKDSDHNTAGPKGSDGFRYRSHGSMPSASSSPRKTETTNQSTDGFEYDDPALDPNVDAGYPREAHTNFVCMADSSPRRSSMEPTTRHKSAPSLDNPGKAGTTSPVKTDQQRTQRRQLAPMPPLPQMNYPQETPAAPVKNVRTLNATDAGSSLPVTDAEQSSAPNNPTPALPADEESFQDEQTICGDADAVYGEVKSLGTELIHYTRHKPWKKKLLTIFVIISSVTVLSDFFFFGHIRQLLIKFVEWMAVNEGAALFAFIGLFIIATLIFVPPGFLFFGAGYAFAQATDGVAAGIITATFACFTGCFIGSLLAFFRARYMMRDLIYVFSRRYPLVRAADKALKRNGFRIMLLLRLCPLIPFSALNYIGGITGINWMEFGASIVGILPSMILTVSMGATTGNVVNSHPTAEQQLALTIMLCTGIAFVIIAIVIAWRFAKKELEAQLEIDSAQLDHYLHPEHATEQDFMEAGIETTYQEDEEDEEWFWIWA